MHLITTITAVLLAGLLVLYVPGASLLAALRLGRIMPPALIPAASLAFSLAALALATSVALALHQPVAWVTAGIALITLASWAVLLRRAKFGPLEALIRSSVWNVPWGAALAAVGVGGLAVSVGYFAWNDSAYHIGQAQKLLHLSAPTFSNTLQFPDGTAHPGYLVPVWQEALAQVAFISRQDPMEVAWILPGLTIATAALTFGGLLWVLTRSRRATTPGTVAWALVMAIGPLPLSDAVYNSMHPGGVALAVLMPLVLAMLFLGSWPELDRLGDLLPSRERLDLTPRIVTRGAAVVAAVTTGVFGLLHVSNLVIMALGMAAYLLVWALRAPWPRAVVLHHLTMFGAVALVAVVCVGSLFPGLNKLETVGNSAAAELQRNQSDLFEGKNGAPLEALLRGDVKDDSYHLRADYLVLGGGMSVIALFALVLSLLAPRWPAAWFFGGTAFVVLAIALTDQLYPQFVNVVSLDQARRIEKSLPLALGLGAASLMVASLLAWLVRRLKIVGWFVGGFLFAAAAWGLREMTENVLVMQGYGGEQIVEPRVLTTALAIAGGLGLVLAVLFVVRLVRGAGGRDRVERVLRLPSWQWPSEILAPGVGVIATALLLVGAWPANARVQDMWVTERLEYKRGADGSQIAKLPLDHRLGEMRVFSPQVAANLRLLKPGSIVLAEPRSRDPYMAMALAPVYVVSSVPRHTAYTPKNRVEDRFRDAVKFYDSKNDLTDDERLQLLLDYDVDAVIAGPQSYARSFLQPKGGKDAPGLKRTAFGKNQWMWLIDRDKLDAHLAKPEAADTRSAD